MGEDARPAWHAGAQADWRACQRANASAIALADEMEFLQSQMPKKPRRALA